MSTTNKYVGAVNGELCQGDSLAECVLRLADLHGVDATCCITVQETVDDIGRAMAEALNGEAPEGYRDRQWWTVYDDQEAVDRDLARRAQGKPAENWFAVISLGGGLVC